MIREIIRFKTTDGKIFKHKNDAVAHDKKQQFVSWYKNNELEIKVDMGANPLGKVNGFTLFYWLIKHRDMVLRLLDAAPLQHKG